jgi:hypothetical protein
MLDVASFNVECSQQYEQDFIPEGEFDRLNRNDQYITSKAVEITKQKNEKNGSTMARESMQRHLNYPPTQRS